MKLDDLKVKRGDAIQPFVEKLLKFLPQLTRPYTTSKDVRFMHTSKGINVVADSKSASFKPFFRASFTQLEATVDVGYVQTAYELRQPTIGEIPLDGMVEGKQKAIPRISLKSGPNDQLRSWLILQVIHQKDPSVKISDAVTVIHSSTLIPQQPDLGWQPLTMLVWKDHQTVARVIPIVMHNLQHHFEPKDSGLGGKHFFWAI